MKQGVCQQRSSLPTLAQHTTSAHRISLHAPAQHTTSDSMTMHAQTRIPTLNEVQPCSKEYASSAAASTPAPTPAVVASTPLAPAAAAAGASGLLPVGCAAAVLLLLLPVPEALVLEECSACRQNRETQSSGCNWA
eukprot:1156424-Pelagomonas_calceolata.AAC.3